MDIIGEYKVVDRWNYCDRPFIIENDPEYEKSREKIETVNQN